MTTTTLTRVRHAREGVRVPRDQAFRGSEVRSHRRGLRLVGVAVHAAARPRLTTFLENEIDRRAVHALSGQLDSDGMLAARSRPVAGGEPRSGERLVIQHSQICEALDRARDEIGPVAGSRQSPPDLCDGPRSGFLN